MKKILLVWLLVLVTLTLLACQTPTTPPAGEIPGGDGSIPCTHTYGAWETVIRATCTTAGMETRVCNTCGEKEERPVDVLAHEEIPHEAQEPDCTAIGWEAYVTCSRCDYTTYEEIPALGHSEIPHEAQEPDCTEIGWKAYVTCSRCDYTTYEEIPALGHDEIPHEAQEPDCTEIGWDAYVTCSRCDYTTYEELPALGHNYATDWSYDTDAHYHVCLREGCGEKADTAPHTYDGELDADCNVCGAVRAVVCSHPTSETVTGYPATCTDAGMTDGEKCTACGEIVTAQVEIPALGHDEIPHEAQAPDCTEIGWEAYVTCSRCDYTTYEEIPALGHDEIPHKAQEPDCIEIGWDAYVTCSRCDYTTYEELPALGHDEIPHEAQAPTYTEVGWEAYVTCSRCDYTTYVEIPVLPPPVGDQIGETCIAADVTLLNQEGTFSVAENRGKVTVLNFWGSWCPPCVAELPHFDQIAAEYADSVTVVAIHSYGGMAQAAPFIQTNYPDTEILFGVDGVNEDYCVQLGGGQYWPMTVIVDANGVITHKRIGALTYNQLKAMIDEALGA